MPDDVEPMDEEGVLDALNAVLPLQARSALSYTLVGGSLTGLDLQPLAPSMHEYAAAELDDARHLVEKIVTLGGTPTTEVAPLEARSGRDALEWLVETESEALELLQACIPPTGQEGRSEALEHRLEHIIMRKQEQIDTLLRALR